MDQAKSSFRNRLLTVGITLTVCPLLLFGAVVWWQNHKLRETAGQGCLRAADADLDHIADSVYRLCINSRAALEHTLRENLYSARTIFDGAGKFGIAAGSPVAWEAKNQFTKALSTISLPRVLIGGAWLGQVGDPQTSVLVVDSVQRLTHAKSTIFQRMNPRGDMLRVATNVIGEDGKRAIGTFIPAIGADGKPNPVVSTILRKETFVGRAFVVNAWYMAAYEPLLDSNGMVTGMLYVGVPEAVATEPLRQSIINTKVGRTGHVFVVNAQGTSPGRYVVSKEGKHDGENVWNARDSQGRLVVQEICRRALTLAANESSSERYQWLAGPAGELGAAITRVKYFKDWDWVIGVSIPEPELYETVIAIDQISRAGAKILAAMGLAALAASCVIWFLLAHGLTRRTGRIIRELSATSNVLSSAAAQVSAASEELAREAGTQAASNESVSASLEEMESMAQQNLRHSRDLKNLATQARGAAEGGGLEVQAMTESMAQIQSAGAQVVNINRIIDEIAFQTNILALNAAVEAARAGEAGLGFAVVADEVRNLARRCAAAAKETEEKIQKSMQAGERGVAVTRQVAQKLDLITLATRQLDELAQSLASASEQQNLGIAQVNNSASQVNRSIQSMVASAQNGAARAGEFKEQARTLEELAAELGTMFQRHS